MSEATLKVQFSSLTEISDALASAQDQFTSKIEEMSRRVDADLAGWGEETVSRQAQRQYQVKLQNNVRELSEALGKVRTAVETVSAEARQTEIDNVAYLG